MISQGRDDAIADLPERHGLQEVAALVDETFDRDGAADQVDFESR